MTKRPGQPVRFYVDYSVYQSPVQFYTIDGVYISSLGANQRIWLDTLSFTEAPNANDGPVIGPFQDAYTLTQSASPNTNYFWLFGAQIAANGDWADATNTHLRFPEPGYPLVAGDIPKIVVQSGSDANWFVYGLARIRPATDGA